MFHPAVMRTLLATSLMPCMFAVCSPAAAGEPLPDGGALTYEQHIRPVLKANCFRCHGGEGEPEGSLDVRLRRLLVAGGESGPAIVAGSREESYLYQRIRDGEMPPTDHKLTTDQVELIGQWIDAGAATLRDEPAELAPGVAISPEDRSHWSFQPVTNPGVPQPAAGDRVRNAIDCFLLARMEPEGLSFQPDADRLTLLKRACFDLLGLPPTDEQLATFMADTAPDAYERLIDRLLASPHYGERWARHWLDVAGYADSEGYTNEDRPRRYAYKYRDYVIRAFNADKPLDEFICEQLAGDEMVAPPYKNLAPDDVERLVATGFLRMGPDGTATGGIDQDMARNQVMADTIKIVSTSLLGLSVGCAQCHDHRYDPILQTDYYRLRAVLEPAYDWKDWRSPDARRVSLYTDVDRALAAAVEAEAAKVAAEKNAQQAEAIAQALDKELEKFPVDQRDALRTAYETAAAERTDEQRQLLDQNPSVNITPGVLYQYNQAAADELKKYDARIADIRAKKPVEDFVRALTEVPGLVPVTYLFHRGDPQQPADAIAPGALLVCTSADRQPVFPDNDASLPTTGRRTAYARWLTSEQHPLVARVLVNRVWMHHFGRGIVETPSDFGMLGSRPTHPALLDWLASELVSGGWHMKRLHKQIMTSTAYRQRTAADADGVAADPEGRWYSRAPVRRLEAEVIRDRMLTASGKLNRRMFGPPVPVKEDAVGQIVVGVDTKADANRPGEEVPLDGEEFRRSVYIEVRRSRPLGMLATFDAPVMVTNCERRSNSTVPSQGLMLLNSRFAVEQAEHFADRVRAEASADRQAQITRAWQLAYARRPNDEEMQAAEQFLTAQVELLAARNAASEAARSDQPSDEKDQTPPSDPERQALANLCQTLFGSNEFLYVD